jgi:outer membrane lipoprotein-sorting protein
MERVGPRNAVAVLCVLLLAGSAGCATAPAAAPAVPFRAPRAASLDEVLAAYEAFCNELQTLSASGDLEVRDLRAGKSRRMGVRLLAGRDGRLYVKGSVAVVTALELVSDGRRFWFQVPSKKTVWTGETGAEGAQAEAEGVSYRALRPEDVTTSLLPEPLAAGDGEALTMEADRETFSIAVAAAGRGLTRRRIWLDRETLRPVRLRRFDRNGDVETEARLGAWKDGGPRRIEISRPLQGYEALLELERVDRNPALPDRAFAPRTPQGYKVIEVEDEDGRAAPARSGDTGPDTAGPAR